MYDSVEVGVNLEEVSFRDVIRKGSEKKAVQRLTWWQRKQNGRELAENRKATGKQVKVKHCRETWSTMVIHIPYRKHVNIQTHTHTPAAYIDFSSVCIRSELQNKGGCKWHLSHRDSVSAHTETLKSDV